MKVKNSALYIINILLCIFVLSSCDSKWDENGKLDGMWQLTEWRDLTADTIVATNQDGIYYCVQLKLIKLQRRGHDDYHLSAFSHEGNSLTIGRTTAWPADTVAPMADLIRYGVPADGRFNISQLTSSRLVLSTAKSVLTFRKY